jgi:hypothetical protein
VAEGAGTKHLSCSPGDSMRLSRDTEPILPTTNMAATNGKSKDGKKKVLVVGAGAAGMTGSLKWYGVSADAAYRNVVCTPFVATSREIRCYYHRRSRLLWWSGLLDTSRQGTPWSLMAKSGCPGWKLHIPSHYDHVCKAGPSCRSCKLAGTIYMRLKRSVT